MEIREVVTDMWSLAARFPAEAEASRKANAAMAAAIRQGKPHDAELAALQEAHTALMKASAKDSAPGSAWRARVTDMVGAGDKPHPSPERLGIFSGGEGRYDAYFKLRCYCGEIYAVGIRSRGSAFPGCPRCSSAARAAARSAARAEARAGKVCVCGEVFTPTRSDARYCSPRCRTAAWRERRAR